ncbi:MAG: sugar phosphate isomerase/epimerase family protein [Phycisphaerales bacterium]
MIKAISYWSMPGGLENTCPINEASRLAKAAGFEGLELAVGRTGVITPTLSEAECCAIRRQIDAAGVIVQTLASGMSWGCCPTDMDEQVRKRSVELHAAAIQRAAWLGCKAMLFVPGAIAIPWEPAFKPVRNDHAMKWARQAVRKLAKVAEKVKVDLCIENVWNGLFYSPLELRDFIDGFESKRVKVYLDVGNVLGYHQYPPHWIELLGKRIGRVHIKDFRKSVGTLAGFCDLTEGDVPWAQTMAALKAVGYDKTVVAEMIPPTPGILERTSAAMDRIFKL